MTKIEPSIYDCLSNCDGYTCATMKRRCSSYIPIEEKEIGSCCVWYDVINHDLEKYSQGKKGEMTFQELERILSNNLKEEEYQRRK